MGSGGNGDGVSLYRAGSVTASAVSGEAILRGLAIATLRTLESNLPPSSAM